MVDHLVPMIITDDLAATRDFYVDALGWTAIFDADDYVQVRLRDDDRAPELAFARPMPADAPLGAHAAFGGGLVVSIPVDDADKHRELLQGRGVDAPAATDKPWGWRSFVVRDPSGVTLDFFHEIADTAAQDAPG